jgi:hypothetical protein
MEIFSLFKRGLQGRKKGAIDELLIVEKNMPKARTRKITREGCNAKIAFKMTEEGKYEIAKIFEGHTHKLTSPSKTQFLRSARNVNSVHKNLLHCYGRANIGPAKVYQLLKEQVGSYDNIGCTKKIFRIILGI